MFQNEVLIDPTEKERLVELLTEAADILDKYPYTTDASCHTVTTMCRAKGYVSDAKKWCKYLHTTDGVK